MNSALGGIQAGMRAYEAHASRIAQTPPGGHAEVALEREILESRKAESQVRANAAVFKVAARLHEGLIDLLA